MGADMMTREKAREELLREAADDHVGLWRVVRLFREEAEGPHSMDDLLEELELLLSRNELEIGFPTRDGRGFERWNLSAHEAIERVRKEWIELGGDPNIGDIAWFTTPA